MKATLKRTLSVLLTLVMLFTAFPLSTGLFTAAARDYAVGDILTFGSYPQSKVTNALTIQALNGIPAIWNSYGYYTGTGSWYDGNMTPSDYMKYKDVSYGGSKYRAVTFTQYRPSYTGYTSSASNTYQNNNGYSPNTVYWFKYEPIQWRVLDPATGLVMCETIIDSQPYSNMVYWVDKDSDGSRESNEYFNNAAGTVYANDYVTSSMRAWLNNDFYNTAFSPSDKASIYATTLDNSARPGCPQYNSASTTDKIFLLSYNEVVNPAYGFSSSYSTYDPARLATGSDYAKAQGLYQTTCNSQNVSQWFLRSPGGSSSPACLVTIGGYASSDYYVNNTIVGCRPALRFNLKSANSCNSGHTWTTDISGGGCRIVCSVCDEVRYDFNTDKWSIYNYNTSISKDMYTSAYGIIYGNILYKKWEQEPHGLCFGLAASTAAMIKYPGLVSSFGKNSIVGIEETYDSNLINMKASEFLRLSNIYQASPHVALDRKFNANLRNLYNAVCDYVEGTGDSVVIDMFPNGHSIYPIGVIDNEDSHSLIIYDSNRPNNTQEFIIEDNFTKWSYSAAGLTYGSEQPDGRCHYSLVADEIFEGSYKYGLNKKAKAIFVEGGEKLFGTSSSKVSVSCLDENFQMYSLDEFTGGDAGHSGDNLYWLTNAYTVTVSASEDSVITLNDVESGIELSVPAGTDADLIVDDSSQNSVDINVPIGQEASILFNTTDGEKLIGVKIEGESSDETISATETEDGITVTGIKNGSVTLTNDDEIIKQDEIKNAINDIEIIYDAAGENENLEVEYECAHANAYPVEATAATCTEPGFEAGTYCPDCETWLSGHEIVAAPGHTPYISKPAQASTCSASGRTAEQKCSVCQSTLSVSLELPLSEHNSHTVEATAATCTESGFAAGAYCPDCETWLKGHEVIEALGHEWSRGNVTKFPTCTEPGELSFRCTRGDCKATKTEPMEPINHSNAYPVEATAATCTEPGFEAGTYCPDCETWLSGHEEIPVAEHVDKNGDGVCDTCGTRFKEPEPPVDPSENCSCNCHKTGIVKFFFKFILFFQKLFKANKVCACGVNHY